MLWAPPPPEPVSYHNQVARIFAYHCNGCHGEAGGLSLRSYKELIDGGNKGPVILPGDAEGSLLIHFVEGRRGKAHRMPAGGAPLSSMEIAVIRRWIDEGATEGPELVTRKQQIISAKMEPGQVTRITCRTPVQAYLVLRVIDPATKKLLWSEVASVKSPRELNDSGKPGDSLHWDLVPAPNWPAAVTVELTVEYTANGAADVELSVAPPRQTVI